MMLFSTVGVILKTGWGGEGVGHLMTRHKHTPFSGKLTNDITCC